MKRGTMPAWQKREAERQKLLEEIKRRLINEEERAERPYLYKTLVFLIGRKLEMGDFNFDNTIEMPGDHWLKSRELLYILAQAELVIDRFERVPAEGLALWAKLFEWAADGVAAPYHRELASAEHTNPKEVYGTDRASDEVPICD